MNNRKEAPASARNGFAKAMMCNIDDEENSSGVKSSMDLTWRRKVLKADKMTWIDYT